MPPAALIHFFDVHFLKAIKTTTTTKEVVRPNRESSDTKANFSRKSRFPNKQVWTFSTNVKRFQCLAERSFYNNPQCISPTGVFAT